MPLFMLLSAWAVALILAGLAIAFIIRPLFTILTEVCGGADRARFWSIYAAILTIMAPLMMVTAPGILDKAAASGMMGPLLQGATFFSLIGIIVAFLLIGHAVHLPITRLTHGPAPTVPTQQEPRP